MIDFRYHLVSLISVFLALAVGIVLGAGPLQDSIGSTLTDQVNALRSEKDDLRQQLATSTEAVTHRDEFTQATTSALVANALTGRSVVVVTLPGVEDDVVEPLTDAVTSAGGSVTGRIGVTDDWTAADRESDRTGLLTSLTGDLPSGYVPTDGTSEERLAQVLATSVVSSADTTPTGTAAADAATALNGLTTAGLIEVDGDLNGLASGALVLVPANPEAIDSAAATASVTEEDGSAYVALASALDSTSGGSVATGPASAAASGGVLTAIRDDDTVGADVSTVDTGSTAMGVVTAVLALQEQLSGGSGAYGFGEGVDAVLPTITPAPAATSEESDSGKKGDK
ncbi:copper transporter [Kineosporia sp. J2-2]|uniref:Copper transporter n=1 Tax=Kineosporia corallincola TaxID=2835133 RepID=A0ABS5TN78_9ACTN|nr:copper transporter [Kineosporia corallincola]MBT0772550.1 copper transporter [Kineosporia corallincola]